MNPLHSRGFTDYEDNTVDREAVARRVATISAQIRQLRHRRDELIFLLDDECYEPDGAHLIEVRDRVTRIITNGTTPDRKALCDALIAEPRLHGTATATPVFRVPLTGEDMLAILGTTTRTTKKQWFGNVPYGAPTVGQSEPRLRSSGAGCDRFGGATPHGLMRGGRGGGQGCGQPATARRITCGGQVLGTRTSRSPHDGLY